MNVLLPRLKPSTYSRANYIKTEIEHMRRYAKLVPAKAESLASWLESAAAKLRADVTGGSQSTSEG